MYQVEVERAYRVVAILEQTARDIEEKIVPKLQELIAHWRHRVLWTEGILLGLLMAGVLAWTLWTGEWLGFSFTHPFWGKLLADPVLGVIVLGAVLGLAGYAHFSIRRLVAKAISTRVQRDTRLMQDTAFLGSFVRAFHRNTRFWRSIVCKQPAGWGPRARRVLKDVLSEADAYVQELNNKFTNPSGTSSSSHRQKDETLIPEKVSAP
jgi:hypothetical protein